MNNSDVLIETPLGTGKLDIIGPKEESRLGRRMVKITAARKAKPQVLH